MRNKILVVDDEDLNRELLRQIFEGEYEIIMARNGQEALEQFARYRNAIAVVLLDLIMPVVNGYQVLQVLNANHETEVIPVILITANTDIKIAMSCYSLGAAEIINKPFVVRIVRQRVVNMIEMFQSRERLERLLDNSNRKLTEREAQLAKFYDNFIDAISNIVEFRDMESGKHIKRVKGITQILAVTYMKLYPDCGLTQDEMNTIVKASAFHDIGKIAISDQILRKPSKLTTDEREAMKSHTTKGCDILAKLENVQDTEQYRIAYEIIRHHHERYDGKGYPDELKGDAIPLSAQLVAMADVYDALISERVYKKAYSKERAYTMIMNGECGVFSPKMMKCFEYSRKVIELFSDSVNEKEGD